MNTVICEHCGRKIDLDNEDTCSYCGFSCFLSGEEIIKENLNSIEIEAIKKNRMTPQELLKPRYELIAEYPSSELVEGDIIELPNDKFAFYDKKSEQLNYFEEDWFDAYPRIFRRLDWWEKRSMQVMPRYILNKTAIPKTVHKIDVWEREGATFWGEENGKNTMRQMWGYMPITEEEFKNYNQ